MALIRYSPIVNNIRGSVGNATFQQSQGQSILRSKPVPSNPGSSYQRAVRQAMVTCEYAWRALTTAQKTGYNNFLRYSPDYQWLNPKTSLSGYQLFLKYNVLRVLNGLSVIEDVTFEVPTFYPNIDELFRSGSYFYIVFNDTIDTDVWQFSVRLSQALTSVYTSRIKDLRIIQHTTGDDVAFNLATSYTAIWGALPSIGSKIGYDLTFFHASMPFVFSPLKGQLTVIG